MISARLGRLKDSSFLRRIKTSAKLHKITTGAAGRCDELQLPIFLVHSTHLQGLRIPDAVAIAEEKKG